jgi:hypothetical protein
LIAFQNMNPIVLDVIQSTRTTTDMTPPRGLKLYTQPDIHLQERTHYINVIPAARALAHNNFVK